MKTKIFITLIWLLCGAAGSDCFAQHGNFYFDMTSVEKNNNLRQQSYYMQSDTALYGILNLGRNYYVKETNTYVVGDQGNGRDYQFKSPMMLGVRFDDKVQNPFTAPVKSFTKSYTSYVINEGTDAVIVAMGITKDNVADYRYHVVENDSIETKPWTPVKLEQKYGALQPYGAIGSYLSPGKIVLVEVINIKDYSIRDGIVLDWRPNTKPVVTQIEVNTSNNYFNLNFLKANRGYATKFKDINIPLDFKFPQDSIKKMRIHLKNHESVPYVINMVYWGPKKDEKPDMKGLAYYFLNEYYDVKPESYAEPGKYQIIIQRIGNLPEDQIQRIDFEVLPPPPVTDKKVALKQLIPYTVAALTGVAILFFIYSRQSRAKLHRVAQQKELAVLKLRSIRAQLNPHFMFNALTSIQNLVNKNSLIEANEYLSKFAALTRQALDSSNEEMLSLDDELQVLDDYLQMEQLRFNFKYEIEVSEVLNQANIEVPAMLLQPFVENAIKHGIATLGNSGKISVAIFPDKTDLVLSVTDDGKGFENAGKHNGYGIKLSEDRIAILNQLYKDQAFSLTIAPAQPGTAVTIRLSNWI